MMNLIPTNKKIIGSWREFLTTARRMHAVKNKKEKDSLHRTWLRLKSCKHLVNNVYHVMVDYDPHLSDDIFIQPALVGHITYLSIKRHDREPIHDWRDLQEIKNQIVGREHLAYEIYPPESLLYDTANQYHLWVMNEPVDVSGMAFGFDLGRVVGNAKDAEKVGAKQRERD